MFIKYFSGANSINLLSDDKEVAANAKKAVVLNYLLDDEDFVNDKNTFVLSNSYIKQSYKEMFNEELTLEKGNSIYYGTNTGKTCLCSVEEKETTCSYIQEDNFIHVEAPMYIASNIDGEYLNLYIGIKGEEYQEFYNALFKENDGNYYLVSISKTDILY